MHDLLPDHPTAEQIQRLTAHLLSQEAAGNGVVLDTWHHFAEGMVARTIRIEKGCCLTGAAHKFGHINIAAGDITVWTSGERKRLTGYHVLASKPGAQRAGFAHETTYWTTVHLNPTNETDLAKLEDMIVHNPEVLQSRRLALASEAAKEIEQ